MKFSSAGDVHIPDHLELPANDVIGAGVIRLVPGLSRDGFSIEFVSQDGQRRFGMFVPYYSVGHLLAWIARHALK